MTAGWWDAPLMLPDLAEAISITTFRFGGIILGRGRLKISWKWGGIKEGGDKYPLQTMWYNNEKKDNIIYSSLHVINVSLTTKFLPFPVCCVVSVFICYSPWGQNNFLCWFRYVLCSDMLFDKRNATSFSFGYSGCLLFVPGNCRCWLLNVIGVFIKFRRTVGNQLCVLHNGVISSAIGDSFLIFDSISILS